MAKHFQMDFYYFKRPVDRHKFPSYTNALSSNSSTTSLQVVPSRVYKMVWKGRKILISTYYSKIITSNKKTVSISKSSDMANTWQNEDEKMKQSCKVETKCYRRLKKERLLEVGAKQERVPGGGCCVLSMHL